MASITINPVFVQIPTSTTITGEEKLVTIGTNGKPTTVSVNQILDKVDDTLSDRIEDQIMESVDDYIDDNLDNICNLNWNNV